MRIILWLTNLEKEWKNLDKMTEQLITFETAKLAKEKGLPQLNNGIYYTKDKEHCLVGWGIDNLREYSAPTQSLLQKWLREVHKVNIGLTFHQSNGSDISYDYCIHFPYGSQTTVTNWTQNNFVSYEEALEEGLQEVLKLIKDELVK